MKKIRQFFQDRRDRKVAQKFFPTLLQREKEGNWPFGPQPDGWWRAIPELTRGQEQHVKKLYQQRNRIQLG